MVKVEWRTIDRSELPAEHIAWAQWGVDEECPGCRAWLVETGGYRFCAKCDYTKRLSEPGWTDPIETDNRD